MRPNMPTRLYAENLFACQYQQDTEAFPCGCNFAEKPLYPAS